MKFLDSAGLNVLWNKIKSGFLALNGGGSGYATIYGYDKISINQYMGGHPAEPYISIIKANSSFYGKNIAAVSNAYGIGIRMAAYPQLYIGELGVRYITNTGEINIVDKTWDKILDTDEALTTEELNKILV